MSVVITLVVAAAVIVAISMVTAYQQRRRHHQPVSRAVHRVSARHQDESGIVVEVLWPVTYRNWHARVETVIAHEAKRFGGRTVHFHRGRFSRHRPFWVAMPVGAHHLTIEAVGHRWTETAEAELTVPKGNQHVVFLCWPAKRRLVTPERPKTEWEVHTIG